MWSCDENKRIKTHQHKWERENYGKERERQKKNVSGGKLYLQGFPDQVLGSRKIFSTAAAKKKKGGKSNVNCIYEKHVLNLYFYSGYTFNTFRFQLFIAAIKEWKIFFLLSLFSHSHSIKSREDVKNLRVVAFSDRNVYKKKREYKLNKVKKCILCVEIF